MRKAKTEASLDNSDQQNLDQDVNQLDDNTEVNTEVTLTAEELAQTLSGNGALKFSHLDDPFCTEFGMVGKFRKPRSYEDIATSMEILWQEDPRRSIQFALYLRMITRKVKLHTPGLPQGLAPYTHTVQRGQGLKHEGLLRFFWIGEHHPNTFQRNLGLLILAGSWRDLFQLLRFDLSQHGWEGRRLDWEFLGRFIMIALNDNEISDLVCKYLPSLQSSSARKRLSAPINHAIATWLANLLFKPSYPSDQERTQRYKAYRKLKASGTAHVWQQQISRSEHLQIDFNTVPGIALSRLLSSRYLSRQQELQDQYIAWLDTQPVLKFNGYPHEIFEQFEGPLRKLPLHKRHTINKQFMGLVESTRDSKVEGSNLIVVRDTSGSMGSIATGTKSSCNHIAKAIALFFAKLLPEGKFGNSWIEFNSQAKLHHWSGQTIFENWVRDESTYVGSTNFLSVIELFCEIRRCFQIPEETFPQGIICISDGEFNPSQLQKTNVETARKLLIDGGFSEEYANQFKIVLWNLQSKFYGQDTGTKFETHHSDVENVFYFSGYSPSVVLFLLGIETIKETKITVPKTMRELIDSALNQELLELVNA